MSNWTETLFVPSGMRNLTVPLEPQPKKGAWFKKATEAKNKHKQLTNPCECNTPSTLCLQNVLKRPKYNE